MVDGVIIDNINFLSPQNIESIDVLKDASSTAVFGSRVSNGVVIGSTKQGKSGEARISPMNMYAYNRMPDNPISSQEMSGENIVKTYISPELINGDPYDATVGGVTASEVQAERSACKEYTLWPDYFLQIGKQQNHWFTISGGGEKANYVLGAGYQEEKGTEFYTTEQG